MLEDDVYLVALAALIRAEHDAVRGGGAQLLSFEPTSLLVVLGANKLQVCSTALQRPVQSDLVSTRKQGVSKASLGQMIASSRGCVC